MVMTPQHIITREAYTLLYLKDRLAYMASANAGIFEELDFIQIEKEIAYQKELLILKIQML